MTANPLFQIGDDSSPLRSSLKKPSAASKALLRALSPRKESNTASAPVTPTSSHDALPAAQNNNNNSGGGGNSNSNSNSGGNNNNNISGGATGGGAAPSDDVAASPGSVARKGTARRLNPRLVAVGSSAPLPDGPGTDEDSDELPRPSPRAG